MKRRFQISELRTLVAKALQTGNYSPAESARVRAVPDTRTIRYYTTLGLISPPAEMRGRVAYYDEMHLAQIVAIKQLQSQSLSLAEIQGQLVGLTRRKLESIAKLPDDFWQSADEYLALSQSDEATVSPSTGPPSETSESDLPESKEAFWLTPAAIPRSRSSSLEFETETPTILRIKMSGVVNISIELPKGVALHENFDRDAIYASLQPLYEELRRQRLTRD